MKHFTLISILLIVLLFSCKNGSSDYEIVKIIEHHDESLFNDFFRGFAYVKVDKSRDSVSLKALVPAIKQTVMSESNKEMLMWLKLYFIDEDNEKIAIFDIEADPTSQRARFENFVFYKGQLMNTFPIDQVLRELLQSKTITLPNDMIGIWDVAGRIEIFYGKKDDYNRVTYLNDGRMTANRVTNLKAFTKDGESIFRGYFSTDYAALDSSDYIINEYGDLEAYKPYPKFQYLFNKLEIPNM